MEYCQIEKVFMALPRKARIVAFGRGIRFSGVDGDFYTGL